MSGRVAKAFKRSSNETNVLTVPSSFGPDPPNVELTPEEQEQAKLGLQWREKEGAYLRLQSSEFFSTLFSQLLVRSSPVLDGRALLFSYLQDVLHSRSRIRNLLLPSIQPSRRPSATP